MKMGFTLHHGDSLHVLAELPENSVDSVVTDPPYGLSFMGKSWDYDVPQTELWAQVLRVLKPGGHLLSFFGTRTYHRGVVRIEDAGFEIRDMIAWLYGSGFPKSHNLRGEHEGWGTALKPAFEPVVMARKPLVGTVAANVQQWGTGAINVDSCRIQAEQIARKGTAEYADKTLNAYGKFDPNYQRFVGSGATSSLGRWPANVLLDQEAAAMLDEQSGELTSGGGVRKPNGHGPSTGSVAYGEWGASAKAWAASSGGASRFFYTAKASPEDRNEGVIRNAHPTVKPTKLMRYLVRLVTRAGGTVLDPFMGSGSTGKACMLEGLNFIGIEREAEYLEIARARIGAAASAGHQATLLTTE